MNENSMVSVNIYVSTINISTIQYNTNLYRDQDCMHIGGTAWQRTMLCTVGSREQCSLITQSATDKSHRLDYVTISHLLYTLVTANTTLNKASYMNPQES